METPKHQFNTGACTSPMDTSVPAATAFCGEAPDPNRADGPARGKLSTCAGIDLGCLRLRAGMKPVADETRRMLPFGSPKGEGRQMIKHRSEEPEESQVVRLIHPKAESVPMPSDMGDGEIVRRSGFWSAWKALHRWPLADRQPRFPRCV